MPGIDARTSRETLIALLDDPDWVTPPSARRGIVRALDAQALEERVVAELGPEIAAWKSFCGYRERLDRTRSDAKARERRLYARRRKLRARLQSRRFS